SAEEFYALGVQKLGEGAYATARAAFQQVIREYPNDPRAADAQYQLAESYYAEQEYGEALSALELVPRQWPSSARAAGALYRAGVIAEEMGNRSRAREYYQEAVQRYPDSDEARQAAARLRAISSPRCTRPASSHAGPAGAARPCARRGDACAVPTATRSRTGSSTRARARRG